MLRNSKVAPQLLSLISLLNAATVIHWFPSTAATALKWGDEDDFDTCGLFRRIIFLVRRVGAGIGEGDLDLDLFARRDLVSTIVI